MIELSNKRTINSKTFDNGDGTFSAKVHTVPIHYFNKLGVGDGQVRCRELDWTLKFNEEKRGWEFLYNFYHPFIPEYANEWLEFRDLYQEKDQITSFRPVADHIKGRLVSPKEIGIEHLTDANAIIYDDAFGKGFDFIVYFTRASMVKTIRIRKESKPDTDVYFDIELKFPETKNVYRQKVVSEIYSKGEINGIAEPLFDKTYEGYRLEFTSDKEFDSEKQLMIGNDQLDGKEWFTYIRSFKTWDDKQTVLGNVGIVLKDSLIYLRKRVSADFLKSSEGDVFTDDTSSPIYSASGDGFSSGAYTGEDETMGEIWDAYSYF